MGVESISVNVAVVNRFVLATSTLQHGRSVHPQVTYSTPDDPERKRLDWLAEEGGKMRW